MTAPNSHEFGYMAIGLKQAHEEDVGRPFWAVADGPEGPSYVDNPSQNSPTWSWPATEISARRVAAGRVAEINRTRPSQSAALIPPG